MDKILSITEIFSINRKTFTEGDSWTKNEDGSDNNWIHEIREAKCKINGINYDCILGFDDTGKLLFQFRKESVNIIFA